MNPSYFDVHQGYKVLTHCHIYIYILYYYVLTFPNYDMSGFPWFSMVEFPWEVQRGRSEKCIQYIHVHIYIYIIILYYIMLYYVI